MDSVKSGGVGLGVKIGSHVMDLSPQYCYVVITSAQIVIKLPRGMGIRGGSTFRPFVDRQRAFIFFCAFVAKCLSELPREIVPRPSANSPRQPLVRCSQNCTTKTGTRQASRAGESIQLTHKSLEKIQGQHD